MDEYRYCWTMIVFIGYLLAICNVSLNRFFVLIYIALSLYVMAIFIPCSGYGGNGGWATHYAGGATRPLVYRVLVPSMISAVRQLPSDDAKEYITGTFLAMRDSRAGQYVLSIRNKKFPGVSSYGGLVDEAHIYRTGMAMIVVYITLLAFIGMLYRLASVLFPENSACAFLAPVVALLWLPTFIYNYAYTYDFAELFFSCACLYFLAKRQFTAYLLCFAIATFNKETTIFLLPFFVAWFYGRMQKGKFFRLLLLQALIYGAVKGWLTLYFMDVPGEAFGNFLARNLHELHTLNELQKAFLLGILWLVIFQWDKKTGFAALRFVDGSCQCRCLYCRILPR